MAKIDKRFKGVWHSDVLTLPDGPAYIHISYKESYGKDLSNGIMDIVYICHNNLGKPIVFQLEGFVSAINDDHFLNLRFTDKNGKIEEGSKYIFAKYSFVNDNELNIWIVANPSFSKAIETKKLKGYVEQKDFPQIVVTDSTSKISEYFTNTANIVDEISDPSTLERLEKEYIRLAPFGIQPWKKLDDAQFDFKKLIDQELKTKPRSHP